MLTPAQVPKPAGLPTGQAHVEVPRILEGWMTGEKEARVTEPRKAGLPLAHAFSGFKVFCSEPEEGRLTMTPGLLFFHKIYFEM